MVGVGSLLRAGPGQPFRGAVRWGVILSECTMDDGLLPVRGSSQITIRTTILTTPLFTILRTARHLRRRSAHRLPGQLRRQTRRSLLNPW
jgi:hypothetical protein